MDNGDGVPEGMIRHHPMPADDVTHAYLKVLFIEHPSGRCAWCDSMRWRLLTELANPESIDLQYVFHELRTLRSSPAQPS